MLLPWGSGAAYWGSRPVASLINDDQTLFESAPGSARTALKPPPGPCCPALPATPDSSALLPGGPGGGPGRGGCISDLANRGSPGGRSRSRDGHSRTGLPAPLTPARSRPMDDDLTVIVLKRHPRTATVPPA